MGGERGYDEAKKITGRSNSIGLRVAELLLAVVVTAASADDGATAPQVLGQLGRPRYPRLEVVYGDGKYNNRELDDWLVQRKAPFRVEVVKRRDGEEGFVKLPKRWVAERSFAWLGRDRRHSKDYEWYPESSESWVRISAISQMLRKLPGRKTEDNPFHVQAKSRRLAFRIAS